MTQSNTNTIEIPQTGQGDISEQAAEWCVYLYSGQATEDGRQQFSQWLKTSDQHTHTYAAIEQTWRDMDLVACDESNPVGPHNKVVAIATKTTGLKKRVAIAAFAAAATILVAVGLWNNIFQHPVTSTQYVSRTAETRIVELADGSKLTLGGASAIETHFSENRREVELIRGRAYFDVTHDQHRAFIVRAADASIRVVGTEFDVAFNAKNISISVAQGLVDVSKTPAGGADANPPPVRLKPGEQVTATLEGTLSGIRDFDVNQVLAWRSGRLEYVDARLADVLAEVNRYRKQKILLADKALGDMRITLAIPANQTGRLLSSLEMIPSVRVDRSARGITIRSILDNSQPER